jgi:hypothetical protein
MNVVDEENPGNSGGTTGRHRRPAEAAHGTRSRFTSAKWRCRCPECSAADKAYRDAYEARRVPRYVPVRPARPTFGSEVERLTWEQGRDAKATGLARTFRWGKPILSIEEMAGFEGGDEWADPTFDAMVERLGLAMSA